MKYYLILMLVLLGRISYATDQVAAFAPPAAPVSATSTSLAEAQIPLPSLGNCDEYTDYFIYQCMPSKCTLPISNYEGVSRTMETIGYVDNKCVHNIKFSMRNKKYPPAESYIYCKLSENGRLEMANLFTRYKKGDLAAYVNPTMSKKLKSECQVSKYKKPE